MVRDEARWNVGYAATRDKPGKLLARAGEHPGYGAINPSRMA